MKSARYICGAGEISSRDLSEGSQGLQNKLPKGAIIIINLEKEVPVVKNSGNIKENIQKSSEVKLPHLTVNKADEFIFSNCLM